MTRQESSNRKSGKKDVSQKREPARLTGKLDKTLVTYALAASAAGVGMMALGQSAEAKVIATPANIVVPINGGVVQFDINGDGMPDFGISATTFVAGAKRHGKSCTICTFNGSQMKVVPAQAANEVVQGTTGLDCGPFGPTCAAALPDDQRIGPLSPVGTGTAAMFIYENEFGGPYSKGSWRGPHPPNPYLGVKFVDSGGQFHYGWVRVVVSGAHATITGYAYETIPNKAINAGKTHRESAASAVDPAGVLTPNAREAASLGMLAVGAPGLVAWRKQDDEEEQAA
jgi:hypothetical protein